MRAKPKREEWERRHWRAIKEGRKEEEEEGSCSSSLPVRPDAKKKKEEEKKIWLAVAGKKRKEDQRDILPFLPLLPAGEKVFCPSSFRPDYMCVGCYRRHS